MGPVGQPETSVRNYHYSLRKKPEERNTHILGGCRLKSHTVISDYVFKQTVYCSIWQDWMQWESCGILEFPICCNRCRRGVSHSPIKTAIIFPGVLQQLLGQQLTRKISRVYFLVLYFQSTFACILCKKSVNPSKNSHFVCQYLKINSKIPGLLVVFLKIRILQDVIPCKMVKF